MTRLGLGIALLVAVTAIAPVRADAQSATSLMLDVGGHYSGRHGSVGPTLELRVGRAAAGGISHHFGVRATAGGAQDLSCQVRPDGDGCLYELRESTLLTAFYEQRASLLRWSNRVRPFVGARVSAARGWDGAGAGAGISYGVQVVMARAVVEIGGLTELQKLWPVHPDGSGWTGLSSGLQTGVGLQF